jgi:hypothetical protein
MKRASLLTFAALSFPAAANASPYLPVKVAQRAVRTVESPRLPGALTVACRRHSAVRVVCLARSSATTGERHAIYLVRDRVTLSRRVLRVHRLGSRVRELLAHAADTEEPLDLIIEWTEGEAPGIDESEAAEGGEETP